MAVGLSHRVGHLELWCSKLSLDLGCLLLQVALAPGFAEGGDDLGLGDGAAPVGRGGSFQKGDGVGAPEVIEGRQGPGIELAEGAAELVELAPASPDQVLVCASQHLDRLGRLGVSGHRTMVVAIGADQVGQQLGVAGVRLGSRGGVTIPVAVDGQRVDGEELVASG